MNFFSRMLISLWIIALLSVAIEKPADAGDYIGDYCWNFAITVDGDPVSGTIQMAINHICGGHFLCSGIISVTSPISFQFTTFGNALFVENQFRITLSAQSRKYDSLGNYTVGVSMYTIFLDPNTLNGVLEGIATYYDGNEVHEGIVTYTGCQ